MRTAPGDHTLKNMPHLTCTVLESGSAQSWDLRGEELQMAGGPPRPYLHLRAATKKQERNPMTSCPHYVTQLLPDHEAHYSPPAMPTSSLSEPCGMMIFNTAFTITQCSFFQPASPLPHQNLCEWVYTCAKIRTEGDHSESSHTLPAPTLPWG